MTRCGLLLKKVTTAGNTMGEGQGGYGDGAVFIDDLWCLCVNLMQKDLVGRIGTEVVDLGLENALEVFGTIDVEVLDASHESESGKHADEPKHMVAMQMGEEDGLQMGETDVRAAQRHLCAFGAVEHEEFLADVDHLRGTEAARGGKGCTASEYVDFKLFHFSEGALTLLYINRRFSLDVVGRMRGSHRRCSSCRRRIG